jgi:membrane fusion protein, multidrug efflux system
MKKMYKIIFPVLLSVLAFGCSGPKSEVNKQTVTPASEKTLESAPLEKGSLQAILQLPAQLAAFEEVSIFPKVNGFVKSVSVDIGSKVRKGDILMELEAPELAQASLQARERLAKSRSDYSLDREHWQRLMEASQTPGAVSPLDLSAARSKMEADSSLSNAEKNNWLAQQAIESYLVVRAPFDGVITERNIHPGALVSSSNKDHPMLELKDTRHLRLEIDIPESAAEGIREKDSAWFRVSAIPGRKLSGIISRKSRNINLQMRTERIEMDVMNNQGLLAPGMFVEVELHLAGDKGTFLVPKTAVVSSTEKKYIILVRNGKTFKEEVKTGMENTEKIEVFGNLQQGDRFIVRGSDEIREGISVP